MRCVKKDIMTIGVVISDLFDYYQQTILAGIRYQAELQGLNIVCFAVGPVPEKEDHTLDAFFNNLSDNAVDVLLLFSGSLGAFSGVNGLMKFIDSYCRVPVVSIGVTLPDIPSVVVDNESGLRDLIIHLIQEHGCKKIGFIKGPDANAEARIRYETYKSVLEENGFNYNYKLVAPGNFEPGDGIKGINLILGTRKEEIDALVCADDYTAIDAIQALKSRGYNIPQDVKVIGFDDIERSQDNQPPLSTVRQPIFSLGSVAVEVALKYQDGIETPYIQSVESQMMIRDSCGCTSKGFYSNKSQFHLELTGSFSDMILDIQHEIVKKYKITHCYKNSYDNLSDNIRRIAQGIISSDMYLDEVYLENTVEEILTETNSFKLNASFWVSIITDFFSAVEFKNFSRDKQFFLKSLYSIAVATLFITEKRLHAFKRLDNRLVIQYINRIGDKLLVSHTQDELKKNLRTNLSILKIQSCFIALYEKDPGWSKVFFHYNKKGRECQEGLLFPSKEFLPEEIIKQENSSYMTLPLIIDSRVIGYVMTDLADVPEMIYEFLSEKISYGLKNIEMMRKINNHRISLEKEVEDRTRELKMANIRLKDRSYRDPLTGLHNRRFLMDVVKPEIEEAMEISQDTDEVKPYCLIMIDLDYFKEVNDTYGHASGDMVIQQLGSVLTELVRQDDYVIRVGGEEFVLVLKDFNLIFFDMIMEKIRKGVEECEFKIDNGESIHKTCSLGGLAFPVNSSEPETVDFITAISIVDKCLYCAKNRGRNRGIIVEVVTELFDEGEDISGAILNTFNECLDAGKIMIHEAGS